MEPPLSRKLFRSGAIVSAMTLVSRLFGYLRDAVIAVIFGASGATDAFVVAFRIPNLLRRLFAEGAFSLAFVPVLSEYKERRSREDMQALIDHVAGALALILFLVTAVGILAAPWIINVFAAGFHFEDKPEQHALATEMLRITFPYILFISLTAFAGGILNSFGRFAIPAFTPVFLNLALIACALWLAPLMADPITALAWGVFIAGVLQLAFQLPFLWRLGLVPRPRVDFRFEGVRRILRLMLPTLFGSSVAQVNLLINTTIASFFVTGSLTWLYLSDRFVELPLALIGVAIGTVILPRLSQQHAAESANGFNATLDWALRLGVLVCIPAMAGLIVLAAPILFTLIQYGQFTRLDVDMAALSLMTYATGLPAFILVKLLAPGFYSRQDTATPVKIGITAMFANMAFNALILTPWLLTDTPAPHAGLALATALAGFVNAGLLYVNLRRHGIYRPRPGWLATWSRTLAATAVMAAVLLALNPAADQWELMGGAMRAAWLAGLIAAGALSYAAVLVALGLRPADLTRD